MNSIRIPKDQTDISFISLVFFGAATLAILSRLLVNFEKFGIGFSILAFLSIVVFLMTVSTKGDPVPKPVYYLGAMAIFFGLMVCVRESLLLTTLNVIAAYLSGSLMILAYRLRAFLGLTFAEHCSVLTYPFYAPGAIEKFAAGLKSRQRSILNPDSMFGSVWPIVRGILLTVPVLLVFGFLLSSADERFASLFKGLSRVSVGPELPGHLIFIGLFFLLFIGSLGQLLRKDLQRDVSSKSLAFFGRREGIVVLFLTTILFAMFIVVQISYLFGGSQQVIDSASLTYATYAREGFFELMTVAALSSGLLLGLNTFSSSPSDRINKFFRVLAGVFAALVAILALSSFIRLFLYEQVYGLTTLRLYSHVFIMWVVCMLGLVTDRIVRPHRRNPLMSRAVTISIGFLIVMNFINPDALIAKNNIALYNKTQNQEVLDIGHLTELSSDAVPVFVRNRDMLSDLVGWETYYEYDAMEDNFVQKTRGPAFDHLYDTWKQQSDGRTWNQFTFSQLSAVRAFEKK